MAYSPAAEAGKKVNGRKWKKTIHGLHDHLATVETAVADRDVEATKAALRAIGALFRPHMNEDRDSFDEIEAVEWFEDEDPTSDFQDGNIDAWKDEFDWRLRDLYDWADYNRVWLDPHRSAA